MTDWPHEYASYETSSENRLEILRRKAEQALAAGLDMDSAALSISGYGSIEELLEELRIYQAELEVQNDELIEVAKERTEAQLYYQGLFNLLPLPAFVIDAKGVVEQFNRAASAISLTTKRLLGTSIYRLLEHQSGSELSSMCKKIRAKGQDDLASENWAALDIELSPVLGEQSTHFKAYLSYYGGDIGSRDHFVLVLRDVSLEEKLNRERALFSAIIDSCDEVIFALNQFGVIVASNGKANDFLSLDEAETSTLIFDCPLPASAHEALRTSLSQLRRNLDIGQHHYVWEVARSEADQRDGETDTYHANIFEIQGGGTHSFMGVILTCETDKIRAARELDVAHQLFKQTDQGMMIVGADARISFVNSAFERITGYKSAEILGKNPRTLSSGRQSKSFYRRFWSALIEDGYWEGEVWNKRKSGEIYPEWLTVSKLSLTNGSNQFLATFSDISDIKEKEDQILNLAFFDQMTGLGNRHRFNDLLTRLTSDEDYQTPFCLMFIDLDGFKAVNDLYGHEAGDFILQRVSSRLRNIKRAGDNLFRLGGDEFVYIFKGMDVKQRSVKAQQIVETLSRPFHLKGQDMTIGASVGVASYPADATDLESLLRHADAAMYQAKSAGGDCFEFFDPNLQEKFERSVRIKDGLKRAIDAGELSCVFHPIVDIQTGAITGHEALMRWHSQSFGSVAPDEFIPEAEGSGLIKDLSQWVVNHSLQQLRELPKEQRDRIGKIFINLSGHDFRDAEQFEALTAIFDQYTDLKGYLAVELTERVLMDNPSVRGAQLQKLQELGAAIAIDDFGTGYSSLSYLANFDVDIIKIDKNFVQEIGQNPRADTICRSIIGMAHTLGVTSLAEGVETEAQLAFLRNNGCQLAQGYYFAKPDSLDVALKQAAQ